MRRDKKSVNGSSKEAARILIASDIPILGAGFNQILSAHDDLRVVAVVQSETAIPEALRQYRPDLLIKNLTIEDCVFNNQPNDCLRFNALSGNTVIRGNSFAGAKTNKAIVFENQSTGDPATSGHILVEGNTTSGKTTFSSITHGSISTKKSASNFATMCWRVSEATSSHSITRASIPLKFPV